MEINLICNRLIANIYATDQLRKFILIFFVRDETDGAIQL